MKEEKSISLVNLGQFSKPADTLIKKVSSAIGAIYEPSHITRVAKAKAKADLIMAESDIEISDLRRRTACRIVKEETSRQENMENITKKALSLLEEESNPDNMDDDWVTNFFDKSRIISNEEMQSLWAQVLAGEANSPGSYSKRTVNLLSDLGKKDAELFRTLCRFSWSLSGFTPLVFDLDADIYKYHGINFGSMSHLDDLGLIQFSANSGFFHKGLPKGFAFRYFGQPLFLTMPKDTDNTIKVGKVLFTVAGGELVRVVNASSVDGFYDYVKEKWQDYIPKQENT